MDFRLGPFGYLEVFFQKASGQEESMYSRNIALRFFLIAGLVVSAWGSPTTVMAQKSGTPQKKAASTAKEKTVNVVMSIKAGDKKLGDVVIELNQEKAPITVANFLSYVDSGHFSGTIFHRVIPDFMVQGGGFTPEMEQKPTQKPIKNEATNGLKNDRGTLAMARTNVVDSATAQFFINVKNNDFLNYKNQAEYGYAVFGKVTQGMDVVDKIVESVQKNGSKVVNGHRDVPSETILIESIRRQ